MKSSKLARTNPFLSYLILVGLLSLGLCLRNAYAQSVQIPRKKFEAPKIFTSSEDTSTPESCNGPRRKLITAAFMKQAGQYLADLNQTLEASSEQDLFINLGENQYGLFQKYRKNKSAPQSIIARFIRKYDLLEEELANAIHIVDKLRANPEFKMTQENFPKIVVMALILGQKNYNDAAVWNGDFEEILNVGIKDINKMELVVFRAIDFNAGLNNKDYYAILSKISVTKVETAKHSL